MRRSACRLLAAAFRVSPPTWVNAMTSWRSPAVSFTAAASASDTSLVPLCVGDALAHRARYSPSPLRDPDQAINLGLIDRTVLLQMLRDKLDRRPVLLDEASGFMLQTEMFVGYLLL